MYLSPARTLRVAAAAVPARLAATSTLLRLVPPRTLSTETSDPTAATSTANADEIAKFNRLAAQWWDPRGELAFLHRMNPVRCAYLREWMAATSREGSLRDSRVLDIGCGAGLLSEALARLGAEVVGADAAAQNVRMAQAHAERDPGLKKKMDEGRLVYRHATAEQLVAEQPAQFAAVCALEILEHVDHPQAFLQSCLDLVPSGGLVFVSTMNRSLASSLVTVTLAEHVFGLVAKGTHDPAKYVTPKELRAMAWNAGGQVLDVEGLWLNPAAKKWTRGNAGVPEDHLINYIACIRKR
ncbi:Hexaprenyldihydroxybenzoate methyltransferase, mitochondrial [Blastocladiella emersonii ATCC 22665]|nr:Hexaprenyldihydroxybenzoate methyltransferase, mitochondrial [Blastocladiella emersonii ATCC 22665]